MDTDPSAQQSKPEPTKAISSPKAQALLGGLMQGLGSKYQDNDLMQAGQMAVQSAKAQSNQTPSPTPGPSSKT